MLHRLRIAAVLLAVLPASIAWTQAAKTDAPEAVTYTYNGPACAPIGFLTAPIKPKGAVRLAAYNVENLFDGKDDPALKGKDDDLPMATDETRLKNLAAAIRALDADVLALEEVESKECLTWFRDTYLKDLGYEHLASEEVGYYRGVEQSILSRYPIKSVEIHPEMKLSDAAKRMPADAEARKKQGWADESKLEKDGFQRSPLVAKIAMPDGSELNLLVVHLKAGGKTFAYQRDLESLSIVSLMDAIRAKDKDAQIAVVGDFNATPMQQPVKELRDKALGGLISAYELRPAADKRKPAADADEDDGGDAPKAKGKAAKSPASDDAKATGAKYLTHSFVPDDSKGKPVQRTIDFIMLSPSLFQKGAKDSYFVLSTPKAGAAGNDRPKGYGSDHNPVAVDLQLGGKAGDKPASK